MFDISTHTRTYSQHTYLININLKNIELCQTYCQSLNAYVFFQVSHVKIEVILEDEDLY